MKVIGSVLLCSFALTACVKTVKGPEDFKPNPASNAAAGSYPSDRPVADQPTNSPARLASRTHVELGSAYIERESFGIALDEARIAVAYDKAYAPAHILLGRVYGLLGQYDNAQQAFDTAYRLAPGDPDVNVEYGWFLCSRNRMNEGVAQLEQATRNPYFRTPSRGHMLIGLCQLLLKNDNAAATALSRAVALEPDNIRANYQLATIAYRAGEWLKAREYINRVTRGFGERSNVEALWLALRIERKLGNRVAEQKLANQLKNDFATSDEYQSYLKGNFE